MYILLFIIKEIEHITADITADEKKMFALYWKKTNCFNISLYIFFNVFINQQLLNVIFSVNFFCVIFIFSQRRFINI